MSYHVVRFYEHFGSLEGGGFKSVSRSLRLISELWFFILWLRILAHLPGNVLSILFKSFEDLAPRNFAFLVGLGFSDF